MYPFPGPHSPQVAGHKGKPWATAQVAGVPMQMGNFPGAKEQSPEAGGNQQDGAPAGTGDPQTHKTLLCHLSSLAFLACGKPRRLPLKVLFWVKQGAHPFLPSDHCCSTLGAASAQSGPLVSTQWDAPAEAQPAPPAAFGLNEEQLEAVPRELPEGTQMPSPLIIQMGKPRPERENISGPHGRSGQSVLSPRPPHLWPRAVSWGEEGESGTARPWDGGLNSVSCPVLAI